MSNHIFNLLILGLGFPPFPLFIYEKKLELLLYLIGSLFKLLFLAFLDIAFASNLVIPPYYIFLFNFFLSCSFFLCLAILLFLVLLAFLFYSFYD